MGQERTPWTVSFLDDTVVAEFRGLPPTLRASFYRLEERIVAVGLDRLGEPYVRHLRGKLWELRMQSKDGIGRAIYVTVSGRRVIVVLVFQKKTQKTPAAVLELAEKRMKEIES
jgi:phage-related protein